MSRKLVLAVIDGMAPAALREAIDAGRAPFLAAVAARGGGIRESAAAFPSVTPVCATAIATGVLQDVHHVPAMCWYWREEKRYVDYGSSMRAAGRMGIPQQLTDLVFNLNGRHLQGSTLFERLDDAGLRTAGTTYLVYRGRHEHRIARDSRLNRVLSTMWRKPVLGPGELFYADLFSSRETGCRSQWGTPGLRDRHAGCVGAYLVEHDLFDFLLLSLPDNDSHSHKYGVAEQVESIAIADEALVQMAGAAGGVEPFLDTHAVVVAADHSHADVEEIIELREAYADFAVLRPSSRGISDAEIALCPSQRSAQLYALVPEAREAIVPRLVEVARELEGVDVVVHRDGEDAVVARGRHEMRFRPGGRVHDARGNRWTVEGEIARVLHGDVDADGLFLAPDYPDALRRIQAALDCPETGDVLLSAAPGWEFPDWGGADHRGAGSHGSLHRADSLGALLFCGLDGEVRERDQWSITDAGTLVLDHFGVTADTLAA